MIIAVIERVLEWWSMGRRQSTVVQRGGCASASASLPVAELRLTFGALSTDVND